MPFLASFLDFEVASSPPHPLAVSLPTPQPSLQLFSLFLPSFSLSLCRAHLMLSAHPRTPPAPPTRPPSASTTCTRIPQAVCSPTRTSLLNGRRPDRYVKPPLTSRSCPRPHPVRRRLRSERAPAPPDAKGGLFGRMSHVRMGRTGYLLTSGARTPRAPRCQSRSFPGTPLTMPASMHGPSVHDSSAFPPLLFPGAAYGGGMGLPLFLQDPGVRSVLVFPRGGGKLHHHPRILQAERLQDPGCGHVHMRGKGGEGE